MNTTIDTPGGSASAPIDLGYTQAELDRAFDQTQRASNLPKLVRHWADALHDPRSRLSEILLAQTKAR